MSNAHNNGKNVTWREACESASNVLLSDVCGRTIERWFLMHTDDFEMFPPNKKGIHAIAKDSNPFVMCNHEDKKTHKIDNDDICKKSKK